MKVHILATVVVVTALYVVRAQEKSVTTGYVLDSACAFIKNLEKPVSRDCALACARAGSPLVILADDGIYWPISSAMPATGQNLHLVKFAGQRVIRDRAQFAPLPGPMKMGSLDTVGKIRVDPQRIKRPVISWCA